MGPRWRYLFNEVGIGLRRNLLVTIATIITVTVSLALMGAGFLFGRQYALAQKYLYADVQVSIFLQDAIATDQQASLERDLRANPVVEDVLYESKQQAWEYFQRIFAEDENLVDSVTAEMLPASFRVELTDPEQYDVITSQFAGYPGIDEIVDNREALDQLFAIMGIFRTTAYVLAGFVLIAALALIATTIRLTAYARREQTGIMKLVGATNWYIRLPFLMEGIVATAVGAVIALGLLMLGETTFIEGLRHQVRFIPFVTRGDVLAVFPLMFIIGIALSSLASFFSLRRFLAV